MANVPSSSWSETSPAGGDNISAGDNKIREMKTQIREVIDVDHDFPSSGQAADVGQHKKVTLQEQADLGTGAVGATILGSQTVSGKGELVYTDEDDNDIQFTSGGKILLTDVSLASVAGIMELIYPVGSVVTLGVSTNPGTLFGVGTWTAIKGKVIVGISDVSGDTEFDTLNETGGSKTNSHTHGAGSYVVPDSVYNKGNGSSGQIALSHPEIMLYNKMSDFAVSGTSATPSDTSNLQPYIVKYVWERTA
jgi:hypothetical protein